MIKTTAVFLYAMTSSLLFSHSSLADIHVGDSISISGTVGGFPTGFWGTTAPVGVLANGQPHVIGGTTVYGDSLFGPAFTVTVTSSAAPNGLSGSVTIDYSAYAPGDFPSHFATIILKNDGSIETASVIDGPGSVSIVGGNSLSYTATGVALFQDPIVTIAWTQVPSPAGAGLLLGLLIGKRQRRR